MPHTDKEIERAAERFQKLAEELDPEAATVHLVREPLPRLLP